MLNPLVCGGTGHDGKLSNTPKSKDVFMKRAFFIFAGLLVFASLFLLPVDGSADMPAAPPSAPLLASAPPAPIIVAASDKESRELKRKKKRARRAKKRKERERKRQSAKRQSKNG